jgi:hypothetical protein
LFSVFIKISRNIKRMISHNRILAKLSIISIRFHSVKRGISSGLKKNINFESEFLFCPKRFMLDFVEANVLTVYSEHD